MDEKTRNFIYDIAPATVASACIIALMLLITQAQNAELGRMHSKLKTAAIACGKNVALTCWMMGGNVTNLETSAGFAANLSCVMPIGSNYSVDCSFGG